MELESLRAHHFSNIQLLKYTIKLLCDEIFFHNMHEGHEDYYLIIYALFGVH